jgi:three-Cys-motif partner protein
LLSSAAMADLLVGELPDDGFYTPTVKQHSVEKIRLHNYYASIFTTAMRQRWEQLAYLGLYAGSGRARIEESGEIIETTALGALRVTHPFTKYILVDNDPACVDALRHRIEQLDHSHDVTLVQDDVSRAVPKIVQAMPRFDRERKLLSFCFIDPFSAAFDFDVIRELASRYRMDFLILPMLGRDIRTNFKQYLENPEDQRIARLIDDVDWRQEWTSRQLPHQDLVPFVFEKFDSAMTRLGYEAAQKREAHPVRIAGKNVFLYLLVLYAKDPLAKKFWKAARFGVDPQHGLEL